MAALNMPFFFKACNLEFVCVIRKVLLMEYIDGIPILNLGDEIAKRGINPGGKIAATAKQ